MPLKNKHCLDWKLYCITSAELSAGRSLEWVVEQAILGGADVIQWREKKMLDRMYVEKAKALHAITSRYRIPLIINDRIAVAKEVAAEGIHLGQEDASLEEARRILGETAIIGRSTHTPEQAMTAEKQGFDYIGVGPVFATPTKPTYNPVGLELVRFAAKNIRIPFVAIGGVDSKNVGQVIDAGARAVAVVRAVMASADPKNEAEKLCLILKPTQKKS